MLHINTIEIDKILDNAEFNGSVHIMNYGETLFHRNMGCADYEAKLPFTDITSIELASLSKQFTAVAVMTLVEQGKLQLDGSIPN